jgi:hypothetical protein
MQEDNGPGVGTAENLFSEGADNDIDPANYQIVAVGDPRDQQDIMGTTFNNSIGPRDNPSHMGRSHTMMPI